MNVEQIIKYLSEKYNTTNIKYIGSGSDSMAFKMDDDYIIRFLKSENNVYENEKQICDFISKYISVEIPHIEIVKSDGYTFSKHKMIKGNAWSWHSFTFNRKKQQNLAKSLAKFMAELHSIPTTKIQKNLENSPYMDIKKVIPHIRPNLTKHQLKFFIKKYDQIINKTPNKSDMVLCHLGIKNANSVIDDNGALCGVFDFGNCGIYERWRDLSVIYSFRNYRLYKMIARTYTEYTGIKVDHKRVADLAYFEWLSQKRWYSKDKFTPKKDYSKVLASTFGHFYKLPWIIHRTILFEIISLHGKLHRKTNNK